MSSKFSQALALSLVLYTSEEGPLWVVPLPSLADSLGLEQETVQGYFRTVQGYFSQAFPVESSGRDSIDTFTPSADSFDAPTINLTLSALPRLLDVISEEETGEAAIKATALAEHLTILTTPSPSMSEGSDKGAVPEDGMMKQTQELIDAFKMLAEHLVQNPVTEGLANPIQPIDIQSPMELSEDDKRRALNRQKADRAVYELEATHSRLLAVLDQASHLSLASNFEEEGQAANQHPVAAKANAMLSTLLDESSAAYQAAKDVVAQLPEDEPYMSLRARRFVA